MIEAVPRYVAVGITCAILHNAIMIAGDLLGLHYVASTMVSFVIVCLWGYWLHARFTFGRDLSATSLFRYALGLAANVPGSLVLMFLFCDLAGLPVAVAAPATTVVFFLWNFAMSHWAIVQSAAARRTT
ncbi:MAG TPA: GtrA family protein [Xanthobacteraceae bacterium]|nr:GtrA family protein [Xanthobacteraceae bacterium]